MYLPTTHLGFGILGALIASLILWAPWSKEALIGGMIFGFLPDVDYVYYLWRYGIRPGKYSHEHRYALTHSFFPHAAVTILIFFLKGRLWGLVYLFSVLSHLILDSVHKPWGIRWLWPWRQHYYSFGINSGLTRVTKKELDSYTQTRGDQPWVKRFVRWKNPYFVFEALTGVGLVFYLIYSFH